MDRFPKGVRSRIMSSIRSESGIEAIPDRMRGLYLRRHPKGIFGKPDFGNKRKKIALFIDGCFWHSCPKHYREPKTNRGYWVSKIKANKKRDRKVNRALRKEGWTVMRIWEHEL